MDVEEALVRAFIVPSQRVRYLEALKSNKRQAFINKRLPHMSDLDPRYATRLDPRRPLVPFEQRAEAHRRAIHDLLRAHGAPDDCHVISSDSLIDGHVLPLGDALSRVVGSLEGSFLSCIPGRLAYFEGESHNERYVLQRDD